ncbi:hypothetical protein BH24ACT15_BH24ACT15_05710 [soil metagenome]
MAHKYRPGDLVIVPWGLDNVPGTVIHVFGPPAEPFVRVRVDLVATDEDVAEAEIGFRASDLQPAPARASG